LPPPGIEPRSPGRPARSQTLYCLSYPAPKTVKVRRQLCFSERLVSACKSTQRHKQQQQQQQHFVSTSSSDQLSADEPHGRVYNTPASYSGGLGLKSRLGEHAILTEVVRGFPRSFQPNAGIFPVPVCVITASGMPGGTMVSINRFSTLCG
jgi:hypothetical protein